MNLKIKTSIFLALALLNIANATPTGKALANSKCVKCHLPTTPTPKEMKRLKAPPFDAILFHAKDALKEESKVKKHIVEFTLNPNVSKSVCESNKVAKFGLMPSQKGSVTKEELKKIADYLYANYPTEKFVKLITKMQTDSKINALKNSPFLINIDTLPHLTKILMRNWDKEALNLSKEQKEKLLVVRKETMTGVKKIKQALKPIESEIVDLMYDGADLKTIQPKVDKVAKLKKQATMIHLKCLKDTIEILNDEQIEYIAPFWDL